MFEYAFDFHLKNSTSNGAGKQEVTKRFLELSIHFWNPQCLSAPDVNVIRIVSDHAAVTAFAVV